MLVRILVHTFLGVIDTYQFKHLDSFLPCLILRIVLVMTHQGFHQLVADSINRVETGHRVLEDHTDLIASEVTHLLFII